MTDIPTCDRCGRPHVTHRGGQACTGHRSKNHATDPGGPCANDPMQGQTKCGAHGGRTPIAKQRAKERLERDAAERLVATLGEPVYGRDPAEIITERIAYRCGHVAWLWQRVTKIDPDALVWGTTKVKTGGDDGGVTEEAKANIWYQLYLEAARELEKLCIDAIRVGLDERRVSLAERQGELIVQLLDGLLRELGHDPEKPETAEVVARHLRLVAS